MKKAAIEALKQAMLQAEPGRAQFIETDLKYALKQMKENGYYSTITGGNDVIISVVNGKAVFFNKKQREAVECREAIKRLQAIIKPGDTVKTVCTHVSNSGMMRHIKVIHNGENITYWTGKALDWPFHDADLKVGGCGMDMGFHTVYTLSSVLFPNGAVVGKGKEARKETSGGYVVKHSWL